MPFFDPAALLLRQTVKHPSKFLSNHSEKAFDADIWE
jgi:hypothetical protein